ncbi:MAG: hypothetical protein COA71_03315 [SAR86 cluster bacterium]|uniref:DUF1015 domain-containing protein n=1 Tax=SAR86 cluster bacterium TaxID=2030880 RepID=A0A2A5CF82_9GAMM|nr:DUF1015 domain-containing protein [Gammaproteobacteria bacterium AH-315-E17]PCJ42554.1 MAG: hypothetical protein COA71_03315 [SAR86 cluster bacterium]
MAKLLPFKGIRPTKALAEKVAAPPYDVLNSTEAREMAAGNPYTFLHVNKPEIDLDPEIDMHNDKVYQKGADNLQAFISDGVIQQDAAQHYYVYRQIMGEHEQTGLVAVASVEEYEQNLIKKHEFTRPEKEDDRVKHMDMLNAQVGPVFLTYQAETGIDDLIKTVTLTEPEYDLTLADGIRHIFWIVSDEQMLGNIEQAFAEVPCLYVADGHHRSAAATRVKNMRQQANPGHNGAEAYNNFLVVVFPHDQMKILDYNRVVTDLNGLSEKDFLKSIEQKFQVSLSDEPFKPSALHEFGMYMDGQWYSLTTRDGVVDETDPVARLDVAVLQDNILSPLLGVENPRVDKRIDFVGGIRGMEGLEKRVDSGECKVAFSCYPTSIEHLMAIADAGEVMPPKSTWFEPKLRSGLVIHTLD